MTTPAVSDATIGSLLDALADVDDRGVMGEHGFVSWAEHLRLSRVRGAALRDRLDPTRPPHVGVLLDNVVEFSVLVAAASMGGLVVVGLNTTRRGAALAADIARSECQLVLVDSDTAGLLDGVDVGVPVVDVADAAQWSAGSAVAPEHSPDADDLLMLIFTSGTTGDPKAVRCTQRTFAAAGTMLAERFSIGADDVVYLSMPMFHSNAMIAGWSVALAGGASIALRRRFSARGFVADVKRYGVTYANYVGKPLNYVLATDEQPDDADTRLRIVYGNEAPAADRERFARRFGCRVIDGFGSTEGGVAITRTPDTPVDALGPLRTPTAIVDPETGVPVPTGEIGEIVNAAGPGLFSGYHNDPVATAERMRGGIYHTGDLGWVDDAGYIHFAGRLGDWLRVDGENLGTGPIERILLRHPKIRQAAVFGVPVEIGDEIEAALVIDGTLDPSSLTRFLESQSDLGPKQWPHRVRIVDALPETATFKTVKRHLRQADQPPTWVRSGHTFTPPAPPGD
ncbi:AMP-binding protein [Gordonia sp. NB41Y]|uniref:AMP-binding protein n=1 Tax=Gordonia sp. NB41Y TaxID=875808 RepID=UPI0002BD6445|nr:AMP-binding protein [Gordonia sp. NB41Y]EMP13201.1 acyl-CoA synthetase [Gordonia sp. NB41Y]WLP89242.1 AMP-binding protein [Gordonia sp. NB41Y]